MSFSYFRLSVKIELFVSSEALIVPLIIHLTIQSDSLQTTEHIKIFNEHVPIK